MKPGFMSGQSFELPGAKVDTSAADIVSRVSNFLTGKISDAQHHAEARRSNAHRAQMERLALEKRTADVQMSWHRAAKYHHQSRQASAKADTETQVGDAKVRLANDNTATGIKINKAKADKAKTLAKNAQAVSDATTLTDIAIQQTRAATDAALQAGKVQRDNDKTAANKTSLNSEQRHQAAVQAVRLARAKNPPKRGSGKPTSPPVGTPRAVPANPNSLPSGSTP